MFTHVRVGSSVLERSRIFYDAVLGALGFAAGRERFGMVFYTDGKDRFAFGAPREGDVTLANGLTIGFKAPSPQAVDDFHGRGLACGGTDEGAPGLRHGAYYAAYLPDPDGNKICAMLVG